MRGAKAIVSSYVGVLIFAAFLFVGAGTLRYRQGLLYLVVSLAGTTLNHLLLPRGSTLTAERAERAAAGEGWDKRLLGAYALVNLSGFLVAGLDSGRFGWSGPVPVAVPIVGVVLTLVGQLTFALAKRENTTFFSTVRVREDAPHPVCQTGPYRLIRHPGYLGTLISQLAFPLVLESHWAFVPAVLGAALLVARTTLEDRFLRAHLPGYADYAARTRWRLVPGLF